MKRLYSLLLSMLLLVVGGVEVEAQTLYKSWDFTNAQQQQIPTGEKPDTLYKDIDLSNAGVVCGGIEQNNTNVSLAFKGNTQIVKSSSDGSFLQLNSKADINDMRAGVRIPAPQGYIVKVTGYAESTDETFTWVGAEIDNSIGEDKFWNNTKTTVAGIAISGEVCGRIKDYVAIENQRYQAAKVEAELVHTASASWDLNKGRNTVDSEKEYYNLETNTGWAGAAFAEFKMDVPKDISNKITKATLVWTAINGNNNDARDNKVYCLNAGQTLDYEDILANKNVYLFTGEGEKTYITNVNGKGTYNEETNVTDVVKAILNSGQANIIFQWTGNAGGATLYGKASESAPKLIIEYTVDGGSRPLRIYNIEVYKPNNNFNFQVPVPTDYDSKGYTVYSDGDVLKGYVLKGNNRTPLNNLSLMGVPDGVSDEETVINLTRNMFKEWDGVGQSANVVKDNPFWNARELGSNFAVGNDMDIVYGSGNVTKEHYADISKADKLRIEGQPGIKLRVLFNRETDEKPDFIELNPTIGSERYVDVDLSSYDYVHLNAIKVQDGNGVISALKLVLQGINYTCEFKGDVTAKIDKNYGTISNIEGKGGAIVVRAVYEDAATGIMNNAEYVITVPYKTNEWYFDKTEKKSNLYTNTSSLADWGLTWKVRKYEGDNENRDMTYLSGPVLSNAIAVKGDNARFIDATAGLIFESGEYHFGTNVTVLPDTYDADPAHRAEARDTYNSANHVTDDPNTAVTMQQGTKLIIPQLKEGQHIRFRWNCHDNKENVGDGIKATNVYDLTKSTLVDKFYTGSGSNENSLQAHQEFIVAKDGDVSFTLDGKGWSNIYNIIVADDFIGTDFNIKTMAETGYNEPDKHDELSYNGHPVLFTYLRKAGEEPIKTKFDTRAGQIHIQSSLNQQFEIADYTGTLNETNCRMGTGSNDWNILYIEPNAHGSFTLIQKGVQNTGQYSDSKPYLLDSLRVKVEVYEYDYNVKPYPYTWAMEHFTTNTGNNTVVELGKDLEEKTLNKDNSCNTTNMSYWTQNGSSYKFNVGYPENMIAWKKRTEKGNVQQTAIYKMTEGERMVAGQTVPVKQKTVVNGKDVYETVATVTFGERSKDENGNDCHLDKDHVFKPVKDGYTQGNGVNGNLNGGTFYTIIPKYDGEVSVEVSLNAQKPLYIEENGTALEGYNGLTESAKVQKSYSFNVKEGQHYKIYAKDSNLGFYGLKYEYNTGGELYVPEMDGLGIMPKEYWKVSDSDWKSGDSDLKLTPSQQGLVFGNREYTLKVPEVQEGQTVYLALTKNDTGTPSVTLADGTQGEIENVGQGIVYDDISVNDYVEGVPLDVYKIEGKGKDGKGEDIDICIKNYTLHKVAVSVDTKDVYKDTGYATEAREYPLDMTLAGLFLGKEQKAYKVTGVDEDKVTIKEIKYVPMAIDCTPSYKNGVMLSGDYVGLEAGDAKTSWPLFTTDINRAISDTEMDDNYLIGVVAQVNANVNEEGIIDQIETVKGANGEDEYYYNYLLACRGFNVKYSDREDPSKPSDPVTDVVVGNVTGVGFYLVIRKGTKMSANDNVGYPGGRPKDHSAYMKLNQWLAKINPLDEPANAAGVHQVFFIDFDNIETDIKDILTDDELSTTDNNSANLLQNGVFYTLQGVPVKNPTKGIYIFNGKKVYVK